jgi:hypothetical protein
VTPVWILSWAHGQVWEKMEDEMKSERERLVMHKRPLATLFYFSCTFTRFVKNQVHHRIISHPSHGAWRW